MTEAAQITPPIVETPAVPTTPAEASSKLAELRADPKWTAGLLKGGIEETKQFHSLHELSARGDNVDAAIAGQLQPGIIQNSEHMQNIGAAEFLREIGFPDAAIKETLNGSVVTTREFYDRVAAWKRNAMTDADWTKRLMSGDAKARLQFSVAHGVLNGSIKEGNSE